MYNKYYIFLVMSCILWGFQPVTIKFVTLEMDILTVIPIRYLFLTITIFILMKITGEKEFLPKKSCVLSLMAMGFFGVTVSNSVQFTGLSYSTVGNMTIISTTAPIITAVLARIVLKERLNLLQVCGIIISFCGTLYLLSKGTMDTFINMSFNRGDIYFFIGEVAWVVYILFSIPVLKKMSVLSVTAWSGLFGAIFTAIYAHFAIGLNVVLLSPLALCSFMYIVWGGGVSAMMLWNLGTKFVGASHAAIFLNLMPVFGVISAYFTLGEMITMQEVISALIIISGVYITTHANQLIEKFNLKIQKNG
ncbi:DMT family transporter [Megamonas hypermegale]|uniref:DMT family transporter n=1 Tax=Megamonas hypermegale TaxID=158847 RepID=UPI00195D9802|nr:DMT family transporter [Megamonas hypermegale]MBM6761316.1 DMT family transporter [Megamonas hypermegale]